MERIKLEEMENKFGLYVHIPFCLQRCFYCDFSTFTFDEVSWSLDDYLKVLLMEIEKGSHLVPKKNLNSLYFGGGTPSLMSLKQFEIIFNNLKKAGFIWDEAEVTIEINPATLDSEKIKELMNMGVNRFSVGAQTFNDEILKKLNRKHNSKQTRETLDLLKQLSCSFSFDLLFALPGQDLSLLEKDLMEIKSYKPQHISPYYLTIPKNHKLNKNRPKEEIEIKMFNQIQEFLLEEFYVQYELSNFALPGYESKHNLLYWEDESYWGLGLSSHSYIKQESEFGVRFWNPKTLDSYKKWIFEWEPEDSFLMSYPSLQLEKLSLNEALTDFCHTSLRLTKGLSYDRLTKKFEEKIKSRVNEPINNLIKKDFIFESESGVFKLTPKGKLLSNLVYLDLTFTD